MFGFAWWIWVMAAIVVVVAVSGVALWYVWQNRTLLRLSSAATKTAEAKRLSDLRALMARAAVDEDAKTKLINGYNYSRDPNNYKAVAVRSGDEDLVAELKALVTDIRREYAYAAEKATLTANLSDWTTDRKTESLFNYIISLGSQSGYSPQFRNQLEAELGMTVDVARAAAEAYFTEEATRLIFPSKTDAKALRQLQALIHDSQTDKAKQAKVTALNYPTDWNDLVATLFDEVALSDFVRLTELQDKSPVGRWIRTQAGDALAARSLVQARIVLAYCDERIYNRGFSPEAIARRADIGDRSYSLLQIMVSELRLAMQTKHRLETS